MADMEVEGVVKKSAIGGVLLVFEEIFIIAEVGDV